MLSGEYYCSPSAILMRHQMTQSQYTLTMLIRNEHQKDGTPAPSSRSLSQILTTPPFTLLAVRVFLLISGRRSMLSNTDAHHRFIAEECDWGFTRFSELRKLFTVQEGHTRPTIEDEIADVSVFVRVLEDPTGVLWHNFVK